MREKNPFGFFSFAIIFLLSIAAIGLWIDRHQSSALLLSFVSAFVAYLAILQAKDSFNQLLILGILARLALFFGLPSLSDDVFRFIWDGILLKNDIHPFEHLPSHYLDQPLEGLTQGLYDRLNSPEYFTIYPPLNQGLFWLSVQFGESWLLNSNIIRFVLLGADVASFYLLRSLLSMYQRNEHLALWYFLNPLVILEFTGNLHFEGIVVCFVLLGIYGLQKDRIWTASFGFGLAIGAKLLPMIYLPFIFLRGIRNRTWWIAIFAGLIGLLTLVPMLNEPFIHGMRSSLDLYFRKFEFNASLYFVGREIGYWVYGYNNIAKIGPLLSFISLSSILLVSGIAASKKWSVPNSLLLILCIYLLFGTVVHPWYILPLIAFGLLSGYRFPIVWSLMIFLTYVGYTASGFELPMWIVVVEYVSVVIFGLIEYQSKMKA